MARLFLIGAGLMGASFARAARRAGLFDAIVAYDVDAGVVARALRAGFIDAGVDSVEAGARAADAVLIAVPPSHIVPIARAVDAAVAGRDVPVFDVGSVKAAVLTALEAALGRVPARFVPCHPMAGAAATGPEAADPDLFVGRRVFLTPYAGTDTRLLARVEGYWRAVGADVHVTDAVSHDRAVAATSHLPHLLAAAYAARFDGDGTPLLEFAGPGFRDFTRIAGGDVALWCDILGTNSTAVVAELDRLLGRLSVLRDELAAGGTRELEATLAAGRRVRQIFDDGDARRGRG